MNVSRFVLLVSLLSCIAAAHAQSLPGTWSAKAPMPEPRGELSVAVLDGKIYAVAGAARGVSATDILDVYDPSANVWRERAALPTALTHVGFAGLNGKLYAVGGFLRDVHQEAQDVAFVYDVAKNIWSALPKSGIARGSVSLAVVDGKIHAIGGRGPDLKTLNFHQVFDPATNQWSIAAPLPVARDHLAVVVAEGRIHVIGGRTDQYTQNTAYHDIYDPKSNTWGAGAAMPTPRSSTAASLLGQEIVVFGGECNAQGYKTYDVAQGFDLKTKSWRELQSAPTGGRHGFGAATVNDTIYVVGGLKSCGGEDATSETWAFRLP